MCGQNSQKRWLLTFSLHCLCSSTSHSFTSRLRLVSWWTLKIGNDLLIFASYALLCIFYCFSHLIGLFSVTWSWLFLLYKFTRFFIYFLFLSDEGPTPETLDFTIRIGSTPTFLYFGCVYDSAYARHYVYFTFIITLPCFFWSTLNIAITSLYLYI